MKARFLDEKNRELEVKIESEDDLWVLYNVLEKGDVVKAWTTRELKADSGSRRKAMKISLRMERAEFQPFTTRLRIHGFIVEGPKELDLEGQRHTVAVDVNDEVVIYREDGWPSHALAKIRESCRRVSIKALAVGVDYEEAAIAYLRDYGVEVIAELPLNLPGKRDPEGRRRALEAKVKEVADVALTAADRFDVNVVVVAGPGFVKDMVAEELEGKVKGKVEVYRESASDGGLRAVYEALRRGVMVKVLRDHELVEEEKLIEEFMYVLAKDERRVAYSLGDVEAAVKMGAVEKLMVSSELLRSLDEEERQRVEEVVREAERLRAKVKVFSSMHETHRRLKALGGIAAILRFRR